MKERKETRKGKKIKTLLHHNLILVGASHVLKAMLVVNSKTLKHLYKHAQGLHC